MDAQQTPYRRQIFVCTNDAKGEKASCGDHKGEDVFRQLREIAKTKKLHPAVRVADDPRSDRPTGPVRSGAFAGQCRDWRVTARDARFANEAMVRAYMGRPRIR